MAEIGLPERTHAEPDPKATTSPTSEADQSFDRLDERTADLIEGLAALTRRLEPVLEHPVPTDVSEGLARETRPQVIERIDKATDRIVDANNQVASLRARLVI